MFFEGTRKPGCVLYIEHCQVGYLKNGFAKWQQTTSETLLAVYVLFEPFHRNQMTLIVL